jgi:cytochrome P450
MQIPTCRNAEYWERPEDFDPDRFSLDKPVPNETTENFNYLPFGGGRRKCIGAHKAAAFSSEVVDPSVACHVAALYGKD